jgi:hypothetical protein
MKMETQSWDVAQVVECLLGPEFKPEHHLKRKKKKRNGNACFKN